MGSRMSQSGAPETETGVAEVEVPARLSSSDSSEEEFRAELEDTSLQDRTFRNILAVLVGRQQLGWVETEKLT